MNENTPKMSGDQQPTWPTPSPRPIPEPVPIPDWPLVPRPPKV